LSILIVLVDLPRGIKALATLPKQRYLLNKNKMLETWTS